MSRPKYYWHNIVRRMVERYPNYDDSKQGKIYKQAVDDAIEYTRSLENGEYKIKAVDMIYFSKKYTLIGAADVLGYSDRTIQRWLIAFVKCVGKNAGW